MARNKFFIKSKKPKNYNNIFENYYSWELFGLYYFNQLKTNIKSNIAEVYEMKLFNHKSNLNLMEEKYYFDSKINLKFLVKSNLARYAMNFLNYADENYIPKLWDVRSEGEKKFKYFKTVATVAVENIDFSMITNTFILLLNKYFIYKFYVFTKRLKYVSKSKQTIYNFIDLILINNITADIMSKRTPYKKRKTIIFTKEIINELRQR